MTQEDKQLLLKDLCARLPYDLIVRVLDINDPTYQKDGNLCNIKYLEGDYNGIPYLFDVDNQACLCDITEIQPYLRPMSSMTEEEKEELKSKCIHTETEEDWEGVRSDVWGIQILDRYDTRRWDNPIWPSTINMDAIDWLNKKKFAYRTIDGKDMFELGLAIIAPEGMYK